MTAYKVDVYIDSLLQHKVASWVRCAPNVQVLLSSTRPLAEREYGPVVFLSVKPLRKLEWEQVQSGMGV